MLLLPIACRRPPLANSESGSGRSFYVFWVLCYVVKLSRLCASWLTLIYRSNPFSFFSWSIAAKTQDKEGDFYYIIIQ